MTSELMSQTTICFANSTHATNENYWIHDQWIHMFCLEADPEKLYENQTNAPPCALKTLSGQSPHWYVQISTKCNRPSEGETVWWHIPNVLRYSIFLCKERNHLAKQRNINYYFCSHYVRGTFLFGSNIDRNQLDGLAQT